MDVHKFQEAFCLMSEIKQEERNVIVSELISTGKLYYKMIRDSYVTYLENVRSRDLDKTREVGSALLSVITGNKKDLSENIEKAYEVLDKTKMFNLGEMILKKWRK